MKKRDIVMAFFAIIIAALIVLGLYCIENEYLLPKESTSVEQPTPETTPVPTAEPTPEPTPVTTLEPTAVPTVEPEAESVMYIEWLGNPFLDIYTNATSEEIISRNIYDMQMFEGKLFLGCGNYDFNAGTKYGVELRYFDTVTDTFGSFGAVPEELLANFKVIGDTMVFPGIDGTESWDFSSWYELENGTLTQYRTIPEACHCFDIVEYHGKVFYALGAANGRHVAVSTDGGVTFDFLPCVNSAGVEIDVNRIYDLFVVDDVLYALDGNSLSVPKLYEYVEEEELFKYLHGEIRLGINAETYNNGGFPTSSKVPTPYGELFVNSGVSLFVSPDDVEMVQPEKGCRYFDVLTRGDTIYLLGGRQVGAGEWEILVFTSTDARNWDVLLSFDAPTYARSFELADDGCFYFGLASDVKTPSVCNGEVLRVWFD